MFPVNSSVPCRVFMVRPTGNRMANSSLARPGLAEMRPAGGQEDGFLDVVACLHLPYDQCVQHIVCVQVRYRLSLET